MTTDYGKIVSDVFRTFKNDNILDDGEGTSLRYDIQTEDGYYVNIVILDYNPKNQNLSFEVFKIVGTPLTPETEDHEKNKEYGFYVSEFDEEAGVLAQVDIVSGKLYMKGNVSLARKVLRELASN